MATIKTIGCCPICKEWFEDEVDGVSLDALKKLIKEWEQEEYKPGTTFYSEVKKLIE